MKWLIASDLHGSGYYCRALLDAFDREKADRLLLLGDLLYHGPRNDLPRDYDPKSVTAMLNERQKSILADYALLSVGSRLLFVTHGHLFHLDALPPLHPGDILLHGHTHVPACETRDGVTYLNPGSLAIPKEDSPHSYMTLEDGVFLWKDLLTGAVYREYRG